MTKPFFFTAGKYEIKNLSSARNNISMKNRQIGKLKVCVENDMKKINYNKIQSAEEK